MKITQVAERLARQLETEDEIGMEGFDSFLDFVSSSIAAVRSLFNKAINEDFRGIEVMPTNYRDLEKLLAGQKKGFKDIEGLVLYRPEKMSGAMADYTKAVAEQYTAMSKIGDTLYQPLIKWFAQGVSNPDHLQKVWNDKLLELNDIDDMQDDIAKFYKRTRDEHGTDMAVCSELYGSLRQMEATYGFLLQAALVGKDLDLKALKAQEEKLTLYVKEMIDVTSQSEAHGDINEIPKATKQKLANALRHVATETEYLVAINYMLVIAITAWNDSMKKIALHLNETEN